MKPINHENFLISPPQYGILELERTMDLNKAVNKWRLMAQNLINKEKGCK